ncbi:MAG: GAF domain-containing protein [Opitutaceae bacterium]|nr:GAF domain-containing protein [Opitutaceae bacterium]
MTPPQPATEPQRLDALRRYEILDTPREQAFDDIVMLAAQICRTPIAMVSLIADDRHWVKSRFGTSFVESSREYSFCAHVIVDPDRVMEVNDATGDPRFSNNPFVTGEPGIRFYAGAPLVTPDGHVLGALCVIDRAPRSLSDEQRTALHILSRHTIAQLELRRRTRELEAEIAERRRSERALEHSERFLQSTLDALKAEIAILDHAGVIIAVNAAWTRFSLRNAAASDGLGPGANYLAVCDRGAAQGAEDAAAVASGIRAVLSGRMEEFRQEYACHGSDENHWFLVRVTGFGPENERRAVVAHVDISERKQAEEELVRLHRQLLDASREAGMAEVATSVLHNVGNVLNSVNVSATLVGDRLRKNSTASFSRVTALLRTQAADLPGFFARDPRAGQLVTYLEQFGQHLRTEQHAMLAELDNLRANIEHIRDIVTMQQGFARLSGIAESVDPAALIADARRMNQDALDRHGVTLVASVDEVPRIEVDKHKVLQVLVNFLRNAIDACVLSGRTDKRIVVHVHRGTKGVVFSVADNGVGIPPENLKRIFNHGFTTKKDGHGFGLHSGANAAREMGGAVTVHSDGPARGATFTLEVPVEGNPETSALPPLQLRSTTAGCAA